jgi:predicted ATPase
MRGGRFIITGGPGSGKSTLLHALKARGFGGYREVSRDIIRREARREGGVLPWTDLEAFSRLAVRAILRQHAHALRRSDTCFFDRGLPDVFGYLRHAGLEVPGEYLQAHGRCRYSPTVFVLPYWEEIYVNDAERPQSAEEASALNRSIREAYGSLGYRLLEVPKAGVEERVGWVLGAAGLG